MRITRICAGIAVGGIVTFGATATASAGDVYGPAFDLGQSYSYSGGSALNLFNTPHTVTVLKVPVPHVAVVQVGGQKFSGNDNLLGALADPLPARVCYMCNDGDGEEAA